MTLAKGQRVSFTFYGKPETARIERIANGIVWLDNGRWMHEASVTPVPGRSKRAKALRIRCNQCELARINGVICHETGCPNTNARYDADSGEWIKQRKCFDCGFTIDADDPWFHSITGTYPELMPSLRDVLHSHSAREPRTRPTVTN